MKISIDKKFPSDLSRGELHRRSPRILVNGVEQQRVVYADDEAGVIGKHVVDRNGKLKTDYKGDLRIQEVRGRVEIRFKETE